MTFPAAFTRPLRLAPSAEQRKLRDALNGTRKRVESTLTSFEVALCAARRTRRKATSVLCEGIQPRQERVSGSIRYDPRPFRNGDLCRMIRFREAELLEKRGWTRYRLAKDVGITELAVYRLAVPGRALQRIDAATLEKLCEVFGVGVGDVLETWPTERRRGSGGGAFSNSG